MEAVHQSKKLDILHGSIWNKLPLYAIPVAATGILEQLFNASDIAIVGNFASSNRTVAIAAVLYEIMSGYLRGFGISLVPAILTMIDVCGTRIAWVYLVFPTSRTFCTLLLAYPASLSITACLILIALLVYRPAHRFQRLES